MEEGLPPRLSAPTGAGEEGGDAGKSEPKVLQGGGTENAGEDGTQCPICLDLATLGPGQGSEVIVLTCGHKIHLDCWLACTVPTISGASGLDKYVENRVCRKCPLCRASYSGAAVDYIQELRGAIEIASSRLESKVRRRAQAMLDKIQTKRARLHMDANAADKREFLESELEALNQQMPLDNAEIYAALMHPIWIGSSGRPRPFDMDQERRLTNYLRAELQQNGLSTSGERNVLIQRLRENDLLTVGFFRELRDGTGLLTSAQPLRSEIDKALSGNKHCLDLAEHKRSQEKKLINSVAHAVALELLEQQQQGMELLHDHEYPRQLPPSFVSDIESVQALVRGLPQVPQMPP